MVRVDRWRIWGAVLGLIVAVLAGCAGEKDTRTVEERRRASARATAEALKEIRTRWMREGTYLAGDEALQNKIKTAVDNFGKLTNYHIGLYTQTPMSLAEMDGRINGTDCEFYFREGGRGDFQTFLVIDDRFYLQEGRVLADYGTGTAGKGHKRYIPKIQEMRFYIRQALKNEIKILGEDTFQGMKVQQYDLRTTLPGSVGEEERVLTVVVDIEPERNVLVHAQIGIGTGSQSADARYVYQYAEMMITKIGEVGDIVLPEKAEVVPKESAYEEYILR